MPTLRMGTNPQPQLPKGLYAFVFFFILLCLMVGACDRTERHEITPDYKVFLTEQVQLECIELRDLRNSTLCIQPDGTKVRISLPFIAKEIQPESDKPLNL